MKLAPVVTPDCIKEAVLNPDVAGPIKAIGAMKQPDKNIPSVAITSNLLIIESPRYFFNFTFLFYLLKEILNVEIKD
tara:strand:- start:3567 stop:3797 length:231 start_codon:yes stop_codon:yes gene_type:complete